MFKRLNKNFTYLTFILAIALYLGFHIHKDLLIAQPNKEKKEITQEMQKTNEENQEINTNSNEQTSEKSKLEKSMITIWSLFVAGGPFMWPLLVISIIGMAIIFERLFYFWFHHFTSKSYEINILDRLNNGIDSVVEYINNNRKYLISKILGEGLEVSNQDPDNFIKGVEREAMIYLTQAERGLSILAAVSTIAPLVGFLGTVSGMINAFDAIANADTVNAKIVASGIKEALITTATGLIVAVPAMAMFQFFQNKVNGFSSEIETIANHIYKELLRIKSKGNNQEITSDQTSVVR